MLRFLTAGESHGKALIGIVEGMVSGLEVSEEDINKELRLRKKVEGRGKRAFSEEDKIEILSGVIEGKTIGSPICFLIKNREQKLDKSSVPRPGHADLSGAIKYSFSNIHLAAERASARETGMRAAIGAIAKKLLSYFNIDFLSHTLSIGGIRASLEVTDFNEETKKKRNESPLYCLDKKAGSEMEGKISEAQNKGDTLGGVSEILIKGVAPGIGSYVHYDRRLDYRLAGALMSIPSVKALEIGEGLSASLMTGSHFHDSLFYEEKIKRKSNNAGGIEGGVSNGEMIVIRIFIKPVPTLKSSLPSFDLINKEAAKAPYIRSDICVVPAVGIIAEAVAAWEIARSFLEKFGGDTLAEVKKNYLNFTQQIKGIWW